VVGLGVAFFSAAGLGVIGFMLVFMLASRQKIKTSYLLLAIFSFSFALALGVMWEIFEFIVDNLSEANMQRSGLNDTMGDLIVDTVGALAASVSGYLYIKFNKAPVLRGMINKFFIKI